MACQQTKGTFLYNNTYSSYGRNKGGRTSYKSKPSSRGNRRGAYIDPSKFINIPKPRTEQPVYVAKNAFADFPFHDGLKKNIEKAGYVTPTAIQDQAITHVLSGKDVIGLANTGTGKTAAFVLPTIQRLLEMPRGTTALIVAPTRELAQQIDDEFKIFSRGAGFLSVLCVGGMNIVPQIRTLRDKPEVIIGTPGRLKDLVERGVLSLAKTHIVILDEADQMLDMGFIGDIEFLIDLLPQERQGLCFSATMSPAISNLIHKLLKDPETISVVSPVTSEHIAQDVIKTTKDQKLNKLGEMLEDPNFEKVLVFGETKWGVQKLADHLNDLGHKAEAIHGNKSQPQRQRALNAFKQDRVKVLVATDVAARGLDIPNVSHVINFDQPNTYSDYVHRIGRTGRAGNTGQAYTFIANY
ncbi:MAG: DEAD/DEAH box helicase [Candidatus Saccharibacteria bacterium]|nr:DEAD/DEAH box helicase [Candidatus Saccharibacteria bacterium]